MPNKENFLYLDGKKNTHIFNIINQSCSFYLLIANSVRKPCDCLVLEAQ